MNNTNNNLINEITNDIESKRTIANVNYVQDKTAVYDSQRKLAELKRYNKDTELKEGLASFVKWFTGIWSVAIIFLIYLIAANIFLLSDKVIIVLVTETLIQTLGLASIVVTHFFPKEK